MTTKECQSRDSRTIECVLTMFRAHKRLGQYVSSLQITIDHAGIVLRGHLPSGDLKADLVPTIRQAGFLGRIIDEVVVEAQAA